MTTEAQRFMWLMVFFDLPVKTQEDRRQATRFRNFLKRDGFLAIQLSVYARICRADEGVKKHLKRVTANLPKSGSVRTLQVTDKQYARMQLLVGTQPENERKASDQMILL